MTASVTLPTRMGRHHRRFGARMMIRSTISTCSHLDNGVSRVPDHHERAAAFVGRVREPRRKFPLAFLTQFIIGGLKSRLIDEGDGQVIKPAQVNVGNDVEQQELTAHGINPGHALLWSRTMRLRRNP